MLKPAEMLAFDPENPFPLVSAVDATNYAEAQLHSEAVDRWLGVETGRIEQEIKQEDAATQKNPQDQEFWIGLPVQRLLTPYTEIRLLLSQLNPPSHSTVIDLGAGYGRMGFVLGRHYPEVNFIGYEVVKKRVQEAKRCLALADCPRAQMVIADLADPGFRPLLADYYFLYDYGSRSAIEKTLQDLREIARSRTITVVGRGRASRDAIERDHPWLSQVCEPRHFAHYSIYRSN